MAGRTPEGPQTEREALAQSIYERMSPAMSVLGLVFLVLVLGQVLVPKRHDVQRFFTAATWAIWVVFVVEFVLRLVIAPSTRGFLRKNWWQALFLVVPFLSFLRLFVVLRLARPARVLVAAVRGTRSARRKLGDRVGWLSAATVIVILVAADLLYEFADFPTYLDALHAAALTAISGEAIGSRAPVAKVLDVVLATYSVVFFASLAGMLGAFFLERRAEHAQQLQRAGASREGRGTGP